MIKRTVALCFALVAFCLITGCGGKTEPIDKNDSAAIDEYFRFENAPKDIIPFLKGTKQLTEDDVISLSEKENPRLEDFKDFKCVFSGNENAYVVDFKVNDRIRLQYVYNAEEDDISFLLVCAEDSTAIDIRTGDVRKYINDRKV